MNFNDILASSIHDIKNSLSLIIHAAESLADDPEVATLRGDIASRLEHEARRANNQMIQLLTLYKFDSGRQTVRIDEQDVEDFLDELVAENRHSAASNGIELHCEYGDTATGYFDGDLVRGVLNSTIGNAERYASKRMVVSACSEDGYLVFRVEDDGDGYSDEMLEQQQPSDDGNGFGESRTNLGLYFARRVAESHAASGKNGFIRLNNRHNLAGGCFELWLP